MRPDFSGEWSLNAARSQLELEQLRALQGAIVRIEHSDPTFALRRRFVLDGQEHEVALSLIADGKGRESRVGDQRRVSSLTWADDKLVFSTLIDAAEGASLNLVQYALEEDGQVLCARERFRGPTLSYENVWVFERAIPQRPAASVSAARRGAFHRERRSVR
jgi:hypothetical protein